MARLPRGEVIDPNEITIVHAINRTVRRCFLLGDDPISGKNFDYRKEWIEELLERFAALFGIELLCYSILSNHYHLILRTRPDIVARWDDTEVARRWLMVCPKRKVNGQPAKPTESELNLIRRCPEKLNEVRRRLSDVSWWMRLLNQRVAQRANLETEESGRFWQDRFRAIRIDDEESLLACAAYIELNPIRAKLAETIETSSYTSVRKRIESETALGPVNSPAEKRGVAPGRRDAFLAKLTIDEAADDIGSGESRTKRRCSDKGFLPMSAAEYFELLDWTARQTVAAKRGCTPTSLPPILKRLGLSCDVWTQLVFGFEDVFCHVAGRVNRINGCRSHLTRRRFRVSPLARRLLPTLL